MAVGWRCYSNVYARGVVPGLPLPDGTPTRESRDSRRFLRLYWSLWSLDQEASAPQPASHRRAHPRAVQVERPYLGRRELEPMARLVGRDPDALDNEVGAPAGVRPRALCARPADAAEDDAVPPRYLNLWQREMAACGCGVYVRYMYV